MVSSRSFDDAEAWKQSILRAKSNNPEKAAPLNALLEVTSGIHQWTQTNHPRPTFCNYCRDKLTGVPWHGFTCDVCKVKAHRKCTDKIVERCKWTSEANIPQHLQYISPENSIIPHQWVEGNLPMPAKCIVCERPCGSVRKLVDWRCLWCACCVHSGCLPQLGRGCNLGTAALSIIPPLAMKEVSAEGTAVMREDAFGGECGGGSPLIVLINSKSGDNQGQRIVKKFRRLLNPLQVFDLVTTPPEFALTFFSQVESFRVLVCGGDGTVGWVLSAFDKLNLHSKCQLAILPLGTGNDLARVLGWGHAFYDDTQLPQLVRTLERAHCKMLDRWSVLSIEGPQADAVRRYEEVVIEKVRAVLDAEQAPDIIVAVTSLCDTIRELMTNVTATFAKVEEWERQEGKDNTDPMTEQCATLLAKLEKLMRTLQEDVSKIEESGFEPGDEEDCVASGEIRRRGSLVNRANSLKKALRDVISIAERGIDQHYRDSACTRRERFRKKRSKTTPSVLRISHSNLSSSSACTPPLSPIPGTSRGDESKNIKGAFCVGREREGSITKSQRSLSCKAGLDVSDTPSTSSGGAIFARIGTEIIDKLPNPSIGTVHPPTPGGTREPSTALDEEEAKTILDDIEKQELQQHQNQPESSITDRPRIYSDSKLHDGGGGGESSSSKPTAAYRLHPESGEKIKISHSDSSLYEHVGESSSGTGGAASGSTLSPARASDVTWNRMKDRERKRTVGSDSGLAYSTQLKSCRNMLSGFAGGSLIAEVLLLNSRVLSTGGNASGVGNECQTLFDQYKETCVMNNYFGIGLDAKIALEFHNKREVSEKTRSRSKLFLWYGMLGGKELMHRTYRNLDQRIRLECDGVPIDLPSLQGIVILNIPSYSGGANFWGRNKDDSFTVQSFDDRILEVVALFGVIHVATSRVPNVVRLQNHRIAQCRHVRIVILGDEPIPVQVDGEPWLQPPGIMQIVHKNRAQMLVKNPAFDATLKKWEEQKERSSTTAPSTPTALGSASENVPFGRRAAEFLRLLETEIAQLSVSSAFLGALEEAALLLRSGGQSEEEEIVGDLEEREEILAAVERVVELLEDHFGFPERAKVTSGHPRLGPAPHFTFEIHGDDPENWRYVINSIRQEMDREEAELREVRHLELLGAKTKRSRLTEWLSKKFGTRPSTLPYDNIPCWTVDQVCSWLSSIGLSEYSSQFKSNDVQGGELIHLERGDIQELGIKKIGHVKRLQSAIDELREREAEKRRAQTRKDSKRAQESRAGSSSRMAKATSLSAERWANVASTSSGGGVEFPTVEPEAISEIVRDPPKFDGL